MNENICNKMSTITNLNKKIVFGLFVGEIRGIVWSLDTSLQLEGWVGLHWPCWNINVWDGMGSGHRMKHLKVWEKLVQLFKNDLKTKHTAFVGYKDSWGAPGKYFFQKMFIRLLFRKFLMYFLVLELHEALWFLLFFPRIWNFLLTFLFLLACILYMDVNPFTDCSLGIGNKRLNTFIRCVCQTHVHKT